MNDFLKSVAISLLPTSLLLLTIIIATGITHAADPSQENIQTQSSEVLHIHPAGIKQFKIVSRKEFDRIFLLTDYGDIWMMEISPRGKVSDWKVLSSGIQSSNR